MDQDVSINSVDLKASGLILSPVCSDARIDMQAIEKIKRMTNESQKAHFNNGRYVQML